MNNKQDIYSRPFMSEDIQDYDSNTTQTSPLSKNDLEKKPSSSYDIIEKPEDGDGEEATGSTEMKRHLKARHVSMISLGGTIGAGLFIGTSTNLAKAGPVGALISFMFFASIVYSVAQSLGEMTTFIPITGSFTAFGSRFVSPSFGAAVGWLYWFSWSLTFAVELNGAAMVIQYWTDKVPIAGWIGIFFVLLVFTNILGVKYYGEIEFWGAAIKVLAIVGWLIYALCMVCGAGKTGPVGFRYWRKGPMGPGILVDDKNAAKFLGFLSSLVNAAFTYQGTELVGITAGESTDPRKNVPKAIRKVFFRIVIFYILSIFFIGLLVPYYDKKLESSDNYISSSPFVIAIINSGTNVLPSIFNAVVLATLLTAGNSDVYIGSRVLYSLASTGVAPKFFMKTDKRGVPLIGVFSTAIFGLLAFMSVSSSAYEVFNWLLNVSTIAGMIAWCSISISHLRFMRALKAQGFERDSLPFISLGGSGYVWYALICNIIVVIIQGFECFFNFSAKSFLTAYVSVFVFLALWIFFQLLFRCKYYIKRGDIDLDSGRIEVERIVWKENPNKNWWEKLWDHLA